MVKGIYFNGRKTKRLYLKGFSETMASLVSPELFDEAKYVAVTDGLTTERLIFTKAKKVGNIWRIQLLGGESVVAFTEPKKARNLTKVMIGTKFVWNGKNEVEDFEDLSFQEAIEILQEKKEEVMLIGLNRGQLVVTSPLEQLWVDDKGRRNALTITGSYYMF